MEEELNVKEESCPPDLTARDGVESTKTETPQFVYNGDTNEDGHGKLSAITDDELNNYFNSLNSWLQNTKLFMTTFSNPGNICYPLIFNRPHDSQGPIQPIYECEMASLWKRFVAEFIDGFILFLIKFYLIIILHDGFNLTLDHYISYLENPTLFFSFTSEIAAVEFISRLLIFSYESYFLYTDGATPGKKIMGLKVYTVEAICPIPGRPTVGAYPCKPLGWWRALFRSILKNVGLFVFPVCYGFMITNSRAGYDHVLNTFVIDTTKYPIRLIQEDPENIRRLLED